MFSEGLKQYGRDRGKASGPQWHKVNGAGDEWMQFQRMLHGKAEDVEPSVCNSAPVEHGSEEDAELKRQN